MSFGTDDLGAAGGAYETALETGANGGGQQWMRGMVCWKAVSKDVFHCFLRCSDALQSYNREDVEIWQNDDKMVSQIGNPSNFN